MPSLCHINVILNFFKLLPYFFNINNMVAQEAHRFVDSVKTEWQELNRGHFSSLVRMLLFHDVITLRKLKEKESASWEYPLHKFSTLNRGSNILSVGLLDFVLFLYGTKEDALAAIKKHNEEISTELLEESGYRLTDLLIPFLVPDQPLTKGDDFIYENQELDLKMHYNCAPSLREIYADVQIISKYDGSERTKIPFFQLLSIAFENYCKQTEAPNVIRY